MRPTSTRGKRPKDTRKLALSSLFLSLSLLCFLWSRSPRLPRCLSSSTSTGLHHVESKRRDLVIITSWRMGSDAMITAVVSLLEAPWCTVLLLRFYFLYLPPGYHSRARHTSRFGDEDVILSYVEIRFSRNPVHVIHDACFCEDIIERGKFFPSVERVTTW